MPETPASTAATPSTQPAHVGFRDSINFDYLFAGLDHEQQREQAHDPEHAMQPLSPAQKEIIRNVLSQQAQNHDGNFFSGDWIAFIAYALHQLVTGQPIDWHHQEGTPANGYDVSAETTYNSFHNAMSDAHDSLIQQGIPDHYAGLVTGIDTDHNLACSAYQQIRAHIADPPDYVTSFNWNPEHRPQRAPVIPLDNSYSFAEYQGEHLPTPPAPCDPQSQGQTASV